jgi:hypothetical protein
MSEGSHGGPLSDTNCQQVDAGGDRLITGTRAQALG